MKIKGGKEKYKHLNAEFQRIARRDKKAFLVITAGSMHDTGCLGLMHWDNPEGWYREGGGRGVQDWEDVYSVTDSC